MIIDNQILEDLSEKYNLLYENFKFVEIKNNFKKKYFIYYSYDEYYFEIDKYKKDKGNFFPFFSKANNLNNIEAWVKGINLTKNKNLKIVKNLEKGAEKRKELKTKYKI